jgi:hypothetical protein
MTRNVSEDVAAYKASDDKFVMRYTVSESTECSTHRTISKLYAVILYLQVIVIYLFDESEPGPFVRHALHLCWRYSRCASEAWTGQTAVGDISSSGNVCYKYGTPNVLYKHR